MYDLGLDVPTVLSDNAGVNPNLTLETEEIRQPACPMISSGWGIPESDRVSKCVPLWILSLLARLSADAVAVDAAVWLGYKCV